MERENRWRLRGRGHVDKDLEIFSFESSSNSHEVKIHSGFIIRVKISPNGQGPGLERVQAWRGSKPGEGPGLERTLWSHDPAGGCVKPRLQ